MFGDHDPARRDDERGRRRDVERAASVATGADDIDGAIGRLDPDDPFAHRGRKTGQLVDRLATHPKSHEQRRQLGRRSLAVHDRTHRAARLVHR